MQPPISNEIPAELSPLDSAVHTFEAGGTPVLAVPVMAVGLVRDAIALVLVPPEPFCFYDSSAGNPIGTLQMPYSFGEVAMMV